MSPDAQRIAIAKACDIQLLPLPQNPKQMTYQRGGCTVELPDYLNDLNAMHEAEKVIKYEQQPYYLGKLKRVIMRTSDIQAASEFDQTAATAAQRAEAFLRALDLWNE